ncbi:hypothetical protein Y032_0044g958 [Ancylostoma ceylanicum]|uniref:Uncharacterized protein n=1 Tax=Ancylostoma ceylanicum TaxID=53326 RepID=A0A016UEU1_9BILA|nr:hypothetical protein Y032_0044g958 [Ancylostoma ceylanicum]
MPRFKTERTWELLQDVPPKMFVLTREALSLRQQVVAVRQSLFFLQRCKKTNIMPAFIKNKKIGAICNLPDNDPKITNVNRSILSIVIKEKQRKLYSTLLKCNAKEMACRRLLPEDVWRRIEGLLLSGRLLSAFRTTPLTSPTTTTHLKNNMAGKCFTILPPGCFDTACYSLVIDHKEGKIYRLGCSSSLDAEKYLDCRNALAFSYDNSTCTETGSRRVCCCYQSGNMEMCNELWKPQLALPNLDKYEVLLLITGIIVIFFVFFSLYSLLELVTKNAKNSVSNSQRDRFKRVDLNFGAVKQ